MDNLPIFRTSTSVLAINADIGRSGRVTWGVMPEISREMSTDPILRCPGNVPGMNVVPKPSNKKN